MQRTPQRPSKRSVAAKKDKKEATGKELMATLEFISSPTQTVTGTFAEDGTKELTTRSEYRFEAVNTGIIDTAV